MKKRTTYIWHAVMVGVSMLGAGTAWWAFAVMPEISAASRSSGSTSSQTVAQTKSSSGASTASSMSTKTQSPSTSSSTTTVSTSDGVDDFGACSEEARTICSGFYTSDWTTWAVQHGYVSASWKLGLVDCLEKNGNLTSDACDESLARRDDLNELVNVECATERGSLCRGITPVPGSEAGNDCLRAHYVELSASCAAALDAHQAAKAME